MYRYVYIYIGAGTWYIFHIVSLFLSILYMFTTFAATNLINFFAVGALPRTKQKKRN